MANKQITFIIGGGEVEIATAGFKGPACEAATKAFSDVLGGQTKNKKRTADYYAKDDKVKLKQST